MFANQSQCSIDTEQMLNFFNCCRENKISFQILHGFHNDNPDIILDNFISTAMSDGVSKAFSQPFITFGNISNAKHHEYFYHYGYQTKQPIPKILHQIWIGNFTQNPRIVVGLESCEKIFKANNWTYYFWDIHRIKKDPFLSKFTDKIFNRAVDDNEYRKLIKYSDILRLLILYRYGGLYIDADTICLKSFDDLLSELLYSIKSSFIKPLSSIRKLRVFVRKNVSVGCKSGFN